MALTTDAPVPAEVVEEIVGRRTSTPAAPWISERLADP